MRDYVRYNISNLPTKEELVSAGSSPTGSDVITSETMTGSSPTGCDVMTSDLMTGSSPSGSDNYATRQNET